MELVDFTGKLNSHNEYIRILNQLKKKYKYIEFALIDDNETDFISSFDSFIISITPKKKWWGTKSREKANVYKLESSMEMYKYLQNLRHFENIFFQITDML